MCVFLDAGIEWTIHPCRGWLYIFLCQFRYCWLNCSKRSSPASPCRTATCLLSGGFFHALTGTVEFWNPNSLRFLKMLLTTLNHQLGVGDVTHCSLRQCPFGFCHTVYTTVVIPLISLGVLAHFRHICKSISRTVSRQSWLWFKTLFKGTFVCLIRLKRTNMNSFSIDFHEVDYIDIFIWNDLCCDKRLSISPAPTQGGNECCRKPAISSCVHVSTSFIPLQPVKVSTWAV